MLRRIVKNSLIFSCLFALLSVTFSLDAAQCRNQGRRCTVVYKGIANNHPNYTKSTKKVTSFQRSCVRNDEMHEVPYAWPSLRGGELSDELARY